MTEIWNLFLFQPLVSALVLFWKFFGDLGVSIVVLTIIIRTILIPLTLPAMRAQKKMAELAPEIKRLKEKHASDKQKFAQAQMELYKKAGANPAAGCLPMIVQFVILIALYQAFLQVLQTNGTDVLTKINETVYPFLQLPSNFNLDFSFLYLNLSKPDLIHVAGLPLPGIFLILAAISQFFSGKMMAPQIKAEEKEAKKTPGKSDDMMVAMQSQMMYLFPAMTIFIGYGFPSGLVVYWFIFSAYQLIQQYFISGWGGLTPWAVKLNLIKNG